MPLNVRNLAWLRNIKGDLPPDFGARMHELIQDLVTGSNILEQQTNSNLSGTPHPPPSIQSVTALPSQTGVHISINHGGEFYRGIYYHVEYADNPHFTNPFPAYSGPAREIDLPVGSQTLYYRVFASYQNSNNTAPSFHGGSTPVSVTGGTSSSLGLSQGSGTGSPGQGLSGFGPVAYRSANGAPPQR